MEIGGPLRPETDGSTCKLALTVCKTIMSLVWCTAIKNIRCLINIFLESKNYPLRAGNIFPGMQVEPGHTVLVHAAAGGVGSLLCQWASVLGATVIGTVSSQEKAAQAREDGCHHTINYKEEDFVSRVSEITSGNGVDVVYDSVGKDTFQVVVEGKVEL